jgi:bifunctional non-homologous end joining protein LigD
MRLYTSNGYDFTARFPRIAEAVNALSVRSCLVDGEATVVGTTGLSVFDLIRYRQHDRAAILCAFDLIELDGKDLRRKALEEPKHTLANVLYRERDGMSSINIITATARSSSSRPARSAAKALSRSTSAHRTAPAAQTTGSRSRTQRPRR